MLDQLGVLFKLIFHLPVALVSIKQRHTHTAEITSPPVIMPRLSGMFHQVRLNATLACGAAILLATISKSAPVDFSGYLVDTYCWNKTATGNYPAHTAPPPGCIDLTKTPELHTMECIRDIAVCLRDIAVCDEPREANK